MARNSMSALIARTRLLINDSLPAGSGQIFSDDDIQGVLDETRQDAYNVALTPKKTFSGNSIQYLTYQAPTGNWEGDVVLKQYLTVVVTPSVSEVIPGIFTFATSTFPPVFLTGKTYDCYRAAADLLERWAAKLVLAYDFSSDGQSFRRSQASRMLQTLAATYRYKQRIGSLAFVRSDLAVGGTAGKVSLAPTEIDYMGSG